MCIADTTGAASLCACIFAEQYIEWTKSFELLSVVYHLCPDSRRQWGRCLNAPVKQRCFSKLGTLITNPYINAVYFLN